MAYPSRITRKLISDILVNGMMIQTMIIKLIPPLVARVFCGTQQKDRYSPDVLTQEKNHDYSRHKTGTPVPSP